jgi:hypothetical protein
MTTATRRTAATTIDLSKLDQIPPLKSGAHEGHDNFCIMEAVAFVAGEPWSDHPACACPVIGAFLRVWNDGLPDDERDMLLRPLIALLPGTRADAATEHRRSLMAADWLVREQTPAWLQLAGLTKQADLLRALPEITDMAQCTSLMPVLTAVQSDAYAALDAAWAAAGAAARDAAWAAAWAAAGAAARAAAGAAALDAAWAAAGDAALDAAWAAAGDAARDAARDAAWAAARDAAWAAAGAAAGDALKPTKLALQQSALRLVHRMIAAQVPS